MYNGDGRARIVVPSVYASHAKREDEVARPLLGTRRSQGMMMSKASIIGDDLELECGGARGFSRFAIRPRIDERRCSGTWRIWMPRTLRR